MCHEVGLILSEMRMTFVCPTRPHRGDIKTIFNDKKGESLKAGLTLCKNERYFSAPVDAGVKALLEEIKQNKPALIIALGDMPLWALTGETGITSWRGSLLEVSQEVKEFIGYSPVVIPTFSPAQIMRVWEWRFFAVRDLKRAADYLASPSSYEYPAYQFAIRPSLPGVIQTLKWLIHRCDREETRIACDIETVARHPSCVGLAWSTREAMCIPLLGEHGAPYWNADEEVAILLLLRQLLTHPNCYVVGQNFNYDNQHFAKHFGYACNLRSDTMIGQHILFPGIPKDLAFISSMYCFYHRYWKDELKDYNRMPTDIHQYWTYNCKDCVITFEASIAIEDLIRGQQLWDQYQFQIKMGRHAFNTMLRGIRINSHRRSEVASELLNAIQERENLIQFIVGSPLNVGSPKQMQDLFYGEMGFQSIFHRKTKRPTLDGDALQTLAKKNPVIKPLTDLIAEKRSLSVFLSTFCLMPLDSDGRMRTSYNVAGPETMRFSSSENAFGSGGNLQNIPKGEEK